MSGPQSQRQGQRQIQMQRHRQRLLRLNFENCLLIPYEDRFHGLDNLYVNDGSDLILPESFLSEAGLSLLPHLTMLLESYSSANENFELFAEYILFKYESKEIEMKSFKSKMTIMNKDSD